MVAIKTLVFVLSTVAAAVLPRDTAQVYSDLQKIDSDTNALTSAVSSWSGSIFTAGTISGDESTLENDIKSATNDANASSAASETQSTQIISFINNTLEPDIRKCIAALEAKKQQFASAGLTSTVQNDLQNLKSETDSLGAALVAKAPSDQQSNAKAALAKIDADFQGAISYFSS